jgi:predicted ATPase/class 3 adenylate cyclase
LGFTFCIEAEHGGIAAEARCLQNACSREGFTELDAPRRASHDHEHMRPELPSGTVTFLFTDVEGSTKLLHGLGAKAYADVLDAHRGVVREACSGRAGVEVDTQGDAFFVAFPTAPGALEAARAITEKLAPGPIALRIGLHTGTPLVTEEGYVGEDVHFAARVAASAHGGQVVLSQATRALLAERYPLVDLGEHRLKDIPEPVAIFQLGNGEFPPLKTISNTNLPRPASSFVGRERELSELLAQIEDGGRLLTLTGPGGSGKTRLALEVAATLVPGYKAGVFWVGLASLRDAAFVTDAVAQTLGAKDGLADHIGEREMLLLLDNLEQVIEAAPELSNLLQACPNLTLLVTSRELLRVQGEVEYRVPPLAEAEAVSLFCQRVQTAASEEIAELCRRLDNLPLAVELAAARAKAFSTEQILVRLSQRLDLLKGGRDADPRQQTLRATIEWSYDLLSGEEQQLFRRLSVFAGGCTLETAEEVADTELDTLQALVEKSLVGFTNERYWMLETIRTFALERLHASGEEAASSAVHADWFAGLAPKLQAELRPGNPRALRAIDDELDNIRIALQWALDSGAHGVVSGLLTGTRFYWIYAARVREGAAWARRALGMMSQLAPNERANLLNAISKLVRFEGDLPLAKRLTSQQVTILRQLENNDALASALADLAWIALEEGDLETASGLADEEFSLRRELGDASGIANALLTKAGVAFFGRRYREAREIYEQTIKTFEDDENFSDVAGAILAVGECSRRLGELATAGKQLRRALELFVETGEVMGWIECVQEIGGLALAQGDLEQAAALLSASERLRTEHSVRLWDPGDWEENLIKLQAKMSTKIFTAAWQAGALLDERDAIAAALDYNASVTSESVSSSTA